MKEMSIYQLLARIDITEHSLVRDLWMKEGVHFIVHFLSPCGKQYKIVPVGPALEVPSLTQARMSQLDSLAPSFYVRGKNLPQSAAISAKENSLLRQPSPSGELADAVNKSAKEIPEAAAELIAAYVPDTENLLRKKELDRLAASLEELHKLLMDMEKQLGEREAQVSKSEVRLKQKTEALIERQAELDQREEELTRREDLVVFPLQNAGNGRRALRIAE